MERVPQRFNHPMTVPADLLAERGRAELLGFYGDVFGWTEMPTLTEDRKRLVLRAHSNEQFVFIEAGDEPICAAETDHIGLSVDTPAELDAMLERARKRASQDPRVTLVDKTIEDHHGVLMLHGGYIGFLLPLRIEVHPSPIGLQCVRSHLGVGPLG